MNTTTSQKNRTVLIFNGFRYRRDKAHQNSVSWRCCKSGCKGRLILYNDDSKKPTTAHNHAPNPAEVDASLAKGSIREQARKTYTSPRAIIQASTSNISDEASVYLPNYDATRRTIQRQRKKLHSGNVSFKSISDLVIEDKYQRSARGEMFLLWDSGCTDSNRIIMFGTRTNVDLLKEFRHWCVDGTFKVAPQFFSQMYTIHSLIDGKAIPLIYALICNKQEVTYRRVFSKLKEIDPLLEPESVLADFESASMNAIREVFPNSRIVGCFFHLAQSLWRKIQQCKLTELYRSQEDVRLKLKMLLALSFVPENDVQFALEIITEDFPEQLQPITEYWECNYVGRRLHNIAPRFPIETWNMFNRVSSSLPKSNNSLEAWHNSFQRALDCQHPSIFRLLDRLNKEQCYVETQVARYRAGFRAPEGANSRYVQQRRRLQVLIRGYSFRLVKEYLQNVAMNLAL